MQDLEPITLERAYEDLIQNLLLLKRQTGQRVRGVKERARKGAGSDV
jgi:hypothetical protein